MDVSVLRLFAPFLMASLSTCSVSAESKIMPPAQGLWERNGEEKKKKKAFRHQISLGQSAGNIAHQVDRGLFLRHKLPFVSSSLRNGFIIK